MRFLYYNEGNPRMDILNDTLRQPVLFAPAGVVKVLTYMNVYSAGPRPMAKLLARGTPDA
jgi:hypothetical protein